MMNKTWRSFTMLALLCGGSAMVGTGCVVRGQMRASTVADTSPPPPRYQTPQPRSGYVWVQGRWVMQQGQWAWQQGSWQPARANMQWQQGRWEQRANRWHWIDGQWIQGAQIGQVNNPSYAQPAPNNYGQQRRDLNRRPSAGPARTGRTPRAVAVQPQQPPRPVGPTMAPPSPRQAQPTSTRRGFVWVRGHYIYNAQNQQEWISGHWRRKRAGHAWIPGRYDWRNDRYNWNDGRWEPERPTQRYQPGRWSMSGGVYVWINGSWVVR